MMDTVIAAQVCALSSVRVNDLAFHAGTQARVAIHEDNVALYAECMDQGDQFPPITVFHDGHRYYIGDGFHRSLAARRLGRTEIAADVHPGTAQDALWFALGANQAHGCPMTQADKKHAIRLAVRTWPERSVAMVARHMGLSQSYVGDIKRQQGAGTPGQDHAPAPARVTGLDGKSYPASAASPSVHPKAAEIERRLRAGESTYAIRVAEHVGRFTVAKIRASAGLPDYVAPVTPVTTIKTGAATEARRARIRQMAKDGYNVPQIAAEVAMTEETCSAVLRAAGLAAPIARSRRLDANRIVAQMVMDAEHLTADINLIDFSELDQARVSAWVQSLTRSRAALTSFIRQLAEEQKVHGEAV